MENKSGKSACFDRYIISEIDISIPYVIIIIGPERGAKDMDDKKKENDKKPPAGEEDGDRKLHRKRKGACF